MTKLNGNFKTNSKSNKKGKIQKPIRYKQTFCTFLGFFTFKRDQHYHASVSIKHSAPCFSKHVLRFI